MTHPADAIYQACGQWDAPLKHVLYESVVETHAQTVVEIGTNIGDSTRILSTALRQTGGRLYSIDLYGPKLDGIAGDWLSTWDGSNLTLLSDDSRTIPWDVPVDVVLVDGAHEYPTPKLDCVRWWGFLRSGGWLLLHDVSLIPDVHRAWQEFAGEAQVAWIYYPHGVGVAVAKKP